FAPFYSEYQIENSKPNAASRFTFHASITVKIKVTITRALTVHANYPFPPRRPSHPVPSRPPLIVPRGMPSTPQRLSPRIPALPLFAQPSPSESVAPNQIFSIKPLFCAR